MAFWDAIEPERGRYDRRVLDALVSLVDRIGRAGLSVIVDLHQDLFGEGFGSAGLPHWIVPAHLYEGYRPRQPWFLDYFHGAIISAFDAFWTSAFALEAFARLWERLSSLLGGGVLGYELFNEPFWGSAELRDFEMTTLPKYYRAAQDAIRPHDPHALLFLQPAPSVNIGSRTHLDLSLLDARCVYAPHFYPASMELGIGHPGLSAMHRQLDGLVDDARRLGRPLFITEWGVRRNALDAARFAFDLRGWLNAHELGACAWELGPSDDAGYGWTDHNENWKL